jgi:hypothetical protein
MEGHRRMGSHRPRERPWDLRRTLLPISNATRRWTALDRCNHTESRHLMGADFYHRPIINPCRTVAIINAREATVVLEDRTSFHHRLLTNPAITIRITCTVLGRMSPWFGL